MNRVCRSLLTRDIIIGQYVSTCCISTATVHRNYSSDSYQFKPSYTSVPDFYAGKSVFLTGATGFVGRLMIERLLYTCKDIEKIYVLIRENPNESVQQRLQKLLDNPIFDKLKHTRSQDLNKVVPIAGDIADPKLGIKLEDEQTLIDKVSVVFHSAAQVKFLAPTSEHINVNYEGTKRVMDLGKKMKNIDVFVYVSTAYSNTVGVVDEIPYPAPRNIEDVQNVLKTYGDNRRVIRKKLLDYFGNSYIFSKKMSEGYVASNHGNMPTVIVRPSMVTSVYKDPLPGYVDSWVAVTGLLCDIASGVTKVLYGRKNVVADLIPADYVCNFLIIAAAKNSRTKECKVYNIATAHVNPITYKRLSDDFIKESKNHDYAVMPFPMVIFTESKWGIIMSKLLLQTFPSYIADCWLRLRGRDPKYMKLQEDALPRSFLGKTVSDGSSWLFKTTRARELISTLDERDKDVFPCNPVTINWKEYVQLYCKGVKENMLRDKNHKKMI